MTLVNPATIEIDGTVYSLHPAKIESTMLGYEDHGIFTGILTLDFGGSVQGAGLMCLDNPSEDANGKRTRIGTAFGLDWIIRVLGIAGVETWESLKGKPVYAVKSSGDHWNGAVEGLASWPSADRTLVFQSHAKAFKAAEERRAVIQAPAKETE